MSMMLKLLFLCLWTATVDSSLREIFSQHLHVGDEETKNEDVSFCIRHIIKDISEHDDFITNVILMNIKDAINISQLHEIKKTLFVTRSFSAKNELYNSIYVTHCDDFSEFKTGMHDAMNDAYFNPFANFVIVMENFKNIKENVTKYLTFHNIYNVTILAKDEDDGSFGIYTFQSPIHPCNHREMLIKISHCSNYTGKSNIFPKIKDLRGCRFKIIGHNLYPLVNFDEDNDGIEQKYIQLFESQAGVTIEVIQYAKMDKLGRIVGNFSYVDVFEKVVNKDYDGAVGGYFLNMDIMKRLSCVYPLSIDYFMAVVRRSDFLDTWQAFSLKGNVTLIVIFVLIGLFSVLSHFLSLFHSQKTDPVRCFLIVFGLFLNRSFLRKFKTGTAESILVASLLLSIFIIPYTLQAFLSSIKTHPLRDYEPKDLVELADYNLIGPNDWPRVGFTKHRVDCETRLDCLKLVRDGKDKYYVTYISLDLYGAYKWILADEQCNLKLLKINEPILTMMRTIYLQRGSVLVRPLNKFLFKVMPTGLLSHHYDKIVSKERTKCKNQNYTRTLATGLKDLKMSYSSFIIGICLSLLVFAVEVLAPH